MKFMTQRLLPMAFPLTVLLCFAALHQVFVWRSHPDAVYMDTLRLVAQLKDWHEGTMSLFDFWSQGSSHRGLINQTFLFLNVELFSLDVMLANRLTGVALFAVASIIVFAFWSATSKPATTPLRFAVRCLVSVLVAALCFSWAGVELLTLDLGLPLWVKNLFFVAYFLWHATFLAEQGKDGWNAATGLSLLGMFIILLVGMGWSYAFVGAVLGVHALLFVSSTVRRGGKLPGGKLIPATALLVALAIYVAAGRTADDGAASNLLGSLPRTLDLSVYALGSPWIGVEATNARQLPLSTAYVAGLLGLLAAAWVVWRKFRRGLLTGSLFPLYLIGYGLLTALSVAAARGSDGPAGVIASRYYMDIVLFSVGTLWAWGEEIVNADTPPKINLTAFACFVGALGLGQAVAYRTEWNITPYRAAIFPMMNEAIAKGVPDEEAADLLQAPLAHARAGAQVLREQHLANFVGVADEACSSKAIGYDKGWYEKEPGGVWMTGEARISVPACSCSLTSQVYLPPDFKPRVISVQDATSNARIKDVTLTPGAMTEIQLPSGDTRRSFIVRSSFVTIPGENGSGDMRQLAAFWGGAAYVCH
ncbi:hypothetical protein ABIE51_000863 [Lysobacter sp. OAE881]|uniref:hypothetical protein n=1 Tax=Lysobacter sp. OAE881 TaxID=2663813 RepID=UPI00178A0630